MDARTREQLRTFHLTGVGLDEYAAASPLRPLGLDALLSAFRNPAGATLPLMHGTVLSALRRPARESLRKRAQELHRRMTDLLAVDDSHSEAGESAAALTASLGADTLDLFDTGALAVAVRRSVRGPRSLDAQRRARVEKAAFVLGQFLRDSEKAPLFWLFHSDSEPEGINDVGGRFVSEPEQAAAVTFCRQRLQEFKPVLQALRVARLEAEGAYEAERHDEPIARIDWQSAEADEVEALPAVVVLGASLDGLSEAVCCGLPLQLLVPCRDLEGAALGNVAMAHREVFVVQESLSEPARLTAGLKQMAAFRGPAVAVVAVPSGEDNDLAAALRIRSREFPAFLYNPARGDTWAKRFEMYRQENDTAVTAAHAAALTPSWQRHFRVMPEVAWDDEQMELATYLARYKDRPPLAIPFLWVTGERGARQRAVLTRELVRYCHDRDRAYRMLEELAGIGNSFVEAAVARARVDFEESAAARERAALEQGRREGARDAIGKVVTALMNPRGIAPKAASPVAMVAQAPVAVLASVETKAADEVPADPYIDSFLCTSCNDCMKVNPLLFLYNSDKQAYLGDPSLGTFAELVKAAEGCPAKCIHPGKPRSGDLSATPAVLARAARLN